MNCEKHLTITITNIILFSVILATAGCSKENSKKRTVKQTEKIIKNLFIFVSNIVNFMILKNWKFYLSKQSSISRQNQPNANNKNGKIF